MLWETNSTYSLVCIPKKVLYNWFRTEWPILVYKDKLYLQLFQIPSFIDYKINSGKIERLYNYTGHNSNFDFSGV